MAPVTVKGSSDGSKDEVGSRKRKTEAETSPSEAKAVKASLPEFSEEKESLERAVDQDCKLFVDTCGQIKSIFDRLLEARKTGSKKNSAKVNEVATLRQEFSSKFLTLKKLNRVDKLRLKHQRDTTQAARQKVDSFDLQLQNLLYEILHLEKEVSKCLQFRSGDEDIELVTLDEFYKKAPPEIAQPSETRSDPHQQRLARLEFEKLQREGLAREQKSREDHRDELETRIRNKKEQLGKLKPMLNSILASTKPVQDFFEMPMDTERDQLELCKYLPHPLFVLYSETKAYGKVFDENLQVLVKGSLIEAKDIFYQKNRSRIEIDDLIDEPALEAEDDDEKSKKKKKKNRGSSSKEERTSLVECEKTKNFLALHPLAVEVKLGIAKYGSVHLTFKYLSTLEFVVVDVKTEIDNPNTSTDREILSSSTLFAHLLGEADGGEKVPNPTYLYRLQKSGLNKFPSDELKLLGCPFIWAQNLAGLNFPKIEFAVDDSQEDAPVQVDEAITQSKMCQIMSEIRTRFIARINLQQQLSQLEKVRMMTIDLPIPEKARQFFPPKISSKLRAWAPVDYEQYVALSVTQHFQEGGVISDSDFFYRLQINREFSSGIASLIALVCIKANYPSEIPIFCLNLHWNGEYNARNSERIRYLEYVVNTHFLSLTDDELKYNVLILQIEHLMASLDVLLESWTVDQNQQNKSKTDFQREKLFFQTVKGRRRLPPLNYQPEMQLYTQ